MISIPPLPSIVSEAFNSSVCWKVNVSAADEPTILRAPVAVEVILRAVVIRDAPAVSSPVVKVPAPAKLNARPGLFAITASLIVNSLPAGIVHDSVFVIVDNCVAERF